MPKDRFKIVPTSHLILIKNGKILLLRRFNTGWSDGQYSVVAGHLDGNETFLQAMIREAKEEAGIELSMDDIEVVHVVNRKSTEERVDFFIRARKWKGEPRNMEPNKCDNMGWFPIDKLPENTIPYVKQAIDCFRKGIFYSEHGW
jgi:ADP-ribose pyrophosphatase YjhB (NUDIX family)